MRKRAGLLVAAFALWGCWSCSGKPIVRGSAERLMSDMKQASGGAALDTPDGFHEKGRVVRDGVEGTYEAWGDLRALRSSVTSTLDGKTMTKGFDGRKAWAVGPDGVLRTDDSPEGLALERLGTYLSIGGYFYPDRFPARLEYRGRKVADGATYEVVAVTPRDAATVELWLDENTHRLERIAGSIGATTYSGVVKRYEVVDGASIPFSLEQVEDQHRTTNELTSFVFEKVPEERFAPPVGAPGS